MTTPDEELDTASGASLDASALDDVLAEAQNRYGFRRAHQARLEQLASQLNAAKMTIGHLADEEVREDEYEGRLVTLHKAGMFDPTIREHRNAHPAAATEKLQDAINGGRV